MRSPAKAGRGCEPPDDGALPPAHARLLDRVAERECVLSHARITGDDRDQGRGFTELFGRREMHGVERANRLDRKRPAQPSADNRPVARALMTALVASAIVSVDDTRRPGRRIAALAAASRSSSAATSALDST